MKTIKSVGIDFLSQVSDLEKRRQFLVGHLFFGTTIGTDEYQRTKEELSKVDSALRIAEVKPG